MDFVYVGLIVALLLSALGLRDACDRLKGSEE